MTKNTNVSIIQLIKSGEISVNYEISNLKAEKGVNVKIRTYLENSNQYNEIEHHISDEKAKLQNAVNREDKLHFSEKLQNLYKVKRDFICNTLYLAETLSKMVPRTDKLKQAIELFEQAKIKEADAILNEADLLDDQFNLITFAEYQEKKIKEIEHDLYSAFN